MAEQTGRIVKRTGADLTSDLASVLERVLDKGIVIAGDIRIQLADVDLLTIKIRLLVTSVDKAEKIGIDWWKSDSFLSSAAQTKQLKARVQDLEGKLLKEKKKKIGKK